MLLSDLNFLPEFPEGWCRSFKLSSPGLQSSTDLSAAVTRLRCRAALLLPSAVALA
jgi:hypothetical protein